MKKARILIVEDESIVSIDISSRLESLGYKIAGCVMSADEAVSNFTTFNPDLVLMDIHLKGDMDGIQAADIIQRNYGTPLIFITAYADEDTLGRAKITQPFGYILKPFQERDLITTIEIALYKHGIEKKLREKEMLLSVTLGSINDGIITLDDSGKILYENKVAETLVGPLEYCKDIFSCLEERVLTDTGKKTIFAKFSNLPVSIVINDLKEEKLKVVVIRDYSDIVNSEAQLVKAKKIAEEVSEAKSNFMANMSHELRTPLNSIIGMTDLVLEGIEDNDLREYLEISRHASESLLSLINSILDFSKIEAGRMDLYHTSFDLDELIENTMRKIAVDANKKNIELRSNISTPLGYEYFGDPKRIFQILLNIVSNAVKFTDNGFVDISRRILNDTETNTEFEISITDSGVGIDNKKIGNIFEAFTQQDDSYTRTHGGTGLGLAIVRNLLSLMDGSVTATSSPGKGSEFIIKINLEKSKQIAPRMFDGPKQIWIVCYRDYICRYVSNSVQSMGGIVHKIAPDKFADVEVKGIGEHILILEQTNSLRQERELFRKDLQKPFSKCIFIEHLGKQNLRQTHGDYSVLMYPFRRIDLYSKIVGTGPQSNNLSVRNRLPDQKGKTILLAEDDSNNQVLLRRIFEKQGFDVIIASDGDEAIRLYKERQPHIVVMDVQMPKKDGIETTRILRAIPSTVHIPILALTAHALDGIKEQCLDAGMDDYISKPFKAPELLEKVEMLLYRKRRKASDDDIILDVDREIISKMVSVYSDLIEEYMAERNYVNIINTAGHLKREASKMNLKKLEAACFKIVLAARNEDNDRLKELLDVLYQYV